MRHLFLLMTLLFISSITAVSAEEQRQTNNYEIFEEGSPAGALDCFSDHMFSGTSRGGNAIELARALQFIEPQINPHTGKMETKTELLRRAENLFFLIQSIDFIPDEVPVTFIDDNKAVIELSDKNSLIKILMTKTDDSGWVISNENFTIQSTKDALNHINTIKENISKFVDDFIPELSSPLNTYFTFIYGVRGVHGYNLKDAVNALDLTDFDPKVIADQGPTWAIQAYRMLMYASPVKPQTLSNNPMYDDEIILFLDQDYGMIRMLRVKDPHTEKLAWKIEYSGSSSINGVYDTLMRHGMRDDIGKMGVKNPTPHIILDDFFQVHFPVMERKLFGINLWKYLLTFLLILSSLIILPIVKLIALPLIRLLLSRANISASKDASKRFILPFQICALSLIWLYGIIIISANPRIMSFSIVAINLILTVTISLLLLRIIDSTCDVASSRFNTRLHILTSVTGKLLKVMVLLAAALYVCHILNINTTNFLAALGIGGFAFALAGKDTIENFFGSIMIIIDRPFQNGDYIKIKDIEGTIDLVSIRSTRIRTFSDSIVTIPNRMFISSEVENFEMRKWRRYKTTFDILYETEVDKIKEFTRGLQELALLNPNTKHDNIQIYFYSLESFSLQIFVSIFFINRGRIEELKAREAFNTQAMKLAERLGIEFAYPTQKLFLTQVAEPAPSAAHSTPAQSIKPKEANKNNYESSSNYENNPGVIAAREISPHYQPKTEKNESEAQTES